MRGCGSGIPHTTRKDDTYAGFFIPKGSAVIANLWLVTDETNRITITLSVLIVIARAFLHNPKIYSDPFAFNPGRFLGPNPERDPRDFVFGHGRRQTRYIYICYRLSRLITLSRICPGLHLADASIFLSCAMSLAVFNISKVVENGITIEPSGEYTTGTIRFVYPH